MWGVELDLLGKSWVSESAAELVFSKDVFQPRECVSLNSEKCYLGHTDLSNNNVDRNPWCMLLMDTNLFYEYTIAYTHGLNEW